MRHIESIFIKALTHMLKWLDIELREAPGLMGSRRTRSQCPTIPLQSVP